MKTFLLSLLLSFATLAAVAQVRPGSALMQRPVTPDSTRSKFYIGVELSSVSYVVADYYKKVGGTFTPLAHVHVGYRLSERASLQVGLAYGATDDNYESIYYKAADSTIYRSTRLSNRGLAIPLTLQLTPFNPGRRLNFYATASLVPIIGEVRDQRSETLDGKTDIKYSAYDSGIYTVATAGVVLNYKISKSFEVYGKANLLYKELKRESEYAKQARSVAIGLNYNLNLKREK